jgi:hypothetical protein
LFLPQKLNNVFLFVGSRRDISWAHEVNLNGVKSLKCALFNNAYRWKGNSSTKSLAYTSLVFPIIEYAAVCWDSYRDRQINSLHRVQNKAAKFAHHGNNSNWETLSQRRKIAHIRASVKVYIGEWIWKTIVDNYKDHTMWTGSIMIGKLGAERKEKMPENIPLQIGPYCSGTNYLQIL